jgi:type I restriction enzyme S subunit
MSFLKYANYKKTLNAQYKEVPSHWNVLSLGYLLADPVTDGPHTTPVFLDDGIPFLSVDGIQDGELVFEKCRYISLSDHHTFSRKTAPRVNDILMGKAASIGKIARVKTDLDFSIWSPLALIRANVTKCRPELLEYLLKSPEIQFQILQVANSNTQLNVGMKDIPKLKVPLPNLHTEQTRIARFLDHETAKIDTLIQEQKRLIELLKEKRQAVISHAVTKGLNPDAPMKDSGVEWIGEVPAYWTLPKIAYYCNVKNGSTPDRSNAQFWNEGTIPWLSSSELNQFHITKAGENITEFALKKSSLSLIKRGAVLIGLVGQGKTRGLSARLDIRATINQNVAAIIPRFNQVDSDFLHFMLQHLYIPIREFGRGGQQAALNCEIVETIRIPLPPVNEQKKIAMYLNETLSALKQLSRMATQAIDLLNERRSALISAVVTGKIDVRNWQPPADESAVDEEVRKASLEAEA